MSKKQTSGADALIQSLHVEGVELVFGYPGGAALHIYDALFTQSEVEHILVCLLYTSPSPRDVEESRMPSSA